MDIATLTPRSRQQISERMEKYKRVDEDGCWIWTGARVLGYGSSTFFVPASGKTRYRKVNLKIHRVSLSLSLGREVKASEFVLHRCDKRACFNPAHLYIGDHAQNMRDRAERTWRPEPEAASHVVKVKLSVDAAADIRQSPLSSKELAAKYSVSRATITRVRAGVIWKANSTKLRPIRSAAPSRETE